jgi:hypothetical protein
LLGAGGFLFTKTSSPAGLLVQIVIAVEKVLFCVPKSAAVPFFHMQLSKTDISGPTRTVGPLFNRHDSVESDVEDEMSRVSC